MSLYGRLDNLPTEVVETIAYYAAALPAAQSAPLLGGHVLLSTLDPDLHHLPPVTPPTPSALVPLLCTSSRIYWKIRRQSCPRLYARIFRAKFDTSALSRRYGRTVLNAPVLATELVKRCRILKRIRHAVSVGRLLPGLEPVSPSAPPQTRMQAERELEENLWTAYLMMTENDGKNYQQLLWADVAGYNQLFYNQEIVPDLLRPTYPTETATRSLAFHLITLVQRAASLDKQDAREATERIFLLRPYVFAAHKYDAFFAPWNDLRPPLPPPHSTTDTASQFHVPPPPAAISTVSEAQPDLSAQRKYSRTCRIQYFGQELTMCHPVLTHAACTMFFQRVERDPNITNISGHLPPHHPDAPAKLAEGFSAATGGGGGASGSCYRPPIHQERFDAPLHRPSPLAGFSGVEPRGGGNSRLTGSVPLAVGRARPYLFPSTAHDKDLLRLLACASPTRSLGLRPSFSAGEFAGSWEGRFCFFDFDAYRQMLQGDMRALYDGSFGEQPQMWKLKERMVRLHPPEQVGGTGNALSAGCEETNGSGDHAHEDVIKHYRLPASLNAESVDPRWARDPADVYPSFGADELSSSEAEEFSDDPDKYEIRIRGTGHSAWGRFTLRGRVRSWDGMIVLKKSYAPDGRGRWLYRGYALTGGTLIGRWRDTFTPSDMNGYEGSFLLHKRQTY